MLLEFSLKNYRSFKDEYTLSLVAEASKAKSENVFLMTFANGDQVRLLRSAMIYGPNASGKSNLLRGFKVLKEMMMTLVPYRDTVRDHDPFKLNENYEDSITGFSVVFVGPDKLKYVYKLEYNYSRIITESLHYYPSAQPKLLFERQKGPDPKIDDAKFGSDIKIKSMKVFSNQTLFSKFGTDEPHEFLSNLHVYFQARINFFITISTITASTINHVENLLSRSPKIQQRLSRLINIADTKIDSIIVRKRESDDDPSSFFRMPDKKYDSFMRHFVYEGEDVLGSIEFPLVEESKGTRVLFVLGTLILIALERGGVFFVDEIDTSLHPRIAKFLVMLFQNPKTNPHDAQLIFTTHETTFLDQNVFRKDQIWFTEKNKHGETELFSVQDFEGVRETTPFEKWYLSGKFGGVPEIKELEFIFEDE